MQENTNHDDSMHFAWMKPVLCFKKVPNLGKAFDNTAQPSVVVSDFWNTSILLLVSTISFSSNLHRPETTVDRANVGQ